MSHWPTLSHRYSSVSEGRRGSLFHKFGLKPCVIPGDNQAVGIGGKAKVLAKVEMPSGMGGVNGMVKKTVVDSPGVPPLTPVSLLKQVGPVIDFNSNTMDLKKIETTTTLRALPSGHVAHKLTEFAPAGWKAPTPEQTELFQVRTDVFRPVTLPGEFKPRSSKHCAGFSSGFVYTVRDRSHLSPSHHQHDPDLCVDDTVSSDLFSDDHLAQGTSDFECSFASGFDVDLSDGKVSCARVADVRWRRLALRCLVRVTRASWQIVLVSWQQASSRIAQTECTHLPEPLVHRAIRWASMDVRDTKRGRCGAIMFPLSCTECSQRGKGQDERKEGGYHDQPKSHTDRRGCLYQGERGRCMSEVRPRTSGLQHRFGTDSMLPWMESRRNTLYIDQSVPQRGRRPWRVAEYQPYSRWKFNEWFWWPRNTLQDETMAHRIHLLQTTGRPRCKRWRRIQLGHRNNSLSGNIFVNSINTFHCNSTPSITTAARGAVDNGSLARASRGRRIHWGPVEYGHENGSDWCATAQSNTTAELKSMNHQQDWSGNARYNDGVKDEPMLTASHV